MMRAIIDESIQEKTDEEILALSVKSPAYFEELVNRYQEAFVRKAKRIVGEREEVQDIVQDAFTKIYLNAERYQNVPGGSFNAWGYRILVNTALTYYQKFKKENERMAPIAGEDLEYIPDKAPRELYKESFFEDQIVFICSKMPRSLAKIFRLYFVDGKTHEDIAHSEGITRGATKTRITRAKKEFKKILLNTI